MPGAQGGQKRVSDPLGLESQMALSSHVGAGNETRSSAIEPVLFIIEPSLQPLNSFQDLTLVPLIRPILAQADSPLNPQGLWCIF